MSFRNYLKITKFKIIKLALIFAIFYFLFSIISHAAGGSVSFQTAVTKLAPGSEFKVAVLISSDEPVNAFDFKINFSTALVDFLGFENDGSIVNLWPSRGIQADGTIVLAGGIIKPFSGQAGQIVNLLFRAKQDGNFNITLSSGSFYLADGKGTAVKPTANSLIVNFMPGGEKTTIAPSMDQTPPNLNVQIVTEPLQKQPLIIFNSTDSQSGVNFTQLRSMSWFNWTDWQLVQNPVNLPAGAWLIEMRAVNGSGLSISKTLYVWPEILKNVGIIILVIILFLAVLYLFYNMYRRKK